MTRTADLLLEALQLGFGRELSVPEQVGHFLEGTVGDQLIDVVAAQDQAPLLPVPLGDLGSRRDDSFQSPRYLWGRFFLRLRHRALLNSLPHVRAELARTRISVSILRPTLFCGDTRRLCPPGFRRTRALATFSTADAGYYGGKRLDCAVDFGFRGAPPEREPDHRHPPRVR